MVVSPSTGSRPLLEALPGNEHLVCVAGYESSLDEKVMISHRIFWIFDTVVLGLAFLGAYFLFPGIQFLFAPGGLLGDIWTQFLPVPETWGARLPPIVDFLWVFLIVALATLIVLELIGGHSAISNQSWLRIIINSFVSPLVGLSLVTLILFAFKSQTWSRLFIFSFVVFSTFGLCLYQLLLRSYFRHRRESGYHAKNVLLIGQPTSVSWGISYFSEHVPKEDYRLIGYLNSSNVSFPVSAADLAPVNIAFKHFGSVDKLGELLINRPIDEVIAIYSTSGGEWISQVIRDCDYFGVLLRIIPEELLWDERKNLKTIYTMEPLYFPAIVLAPKNWSTDALFVKRLFDIVVSGLLLIFLLPLLALIALAIKITTPHLPVFYPWRVVGRNGVEFTGYKFTTMYADADEKKVKLEQYNEMKGPVFKIKNDPRVTQLGYLLRKFSVNELPQLWSVLKGDMSLVGPRPAFRHELERYEFWQKRKLSIKPGITCLWQVRGRNKISNFDDWAAMDLEYIDNWSLWLDFKILVKTLWVVIAGTGS
jgi:exopolysaccharide biosynthesis polyprenyl glycosylphosphotransferase